MVNTSSFQHPSYQQPNWPTEVTERSQQTSLATLHKTDTTTMAGASSKVFYVLLLAGFVAMVASASTPIPGSASGTYTRSGEPARVRDPQNPAGIVSTMINSGLTTYSTENGVTATINGTPDPLLINIVADQQSFHGDWFIWNLITIDGTDTSLQWSGGN